MQPHHEVHHLHLEHSTAPIQPIDRLALFPKTDHWQIHAKQVQRGMKM